MRAVVHAAFLCSVLATSFVDLARLPVTVMRPTGAMQLVPWGFYERLLTPGGMAALKVLLVASLIASAAGLLTGLTTKTSALLVVFEQGLLRSFGHFNHDEMLGVYFLFVLAFTPCGEGFSLDSFRDRDRPPRPAFAYGYPVLLMRLLLAWVYFSSALIKLRVAGLSAYLGADNLPSLAVHHSLDNLHDTQFRLAFLLPRVREYTPLAVGLVLAWELLFPLAVFSRRARPWLLGFGVLFHVSTIFLMNVFFPHLLVMYLVFVDWPRLGARAARSRLFAGLTRGRKA